eukprot:TRINITY_DN8419_c0_g1_i5.p1 TRINITY_DN8419_c0_g1~~TRINITY_DN8419_c0_g1_i5.p1  ORF type:complete len:240 (-),score=64.91 TRINITY_DN8419_c0_g1_i5:143-862(-)
MGTCIGNRNTYRNPMQKACSAFENRFRLFYHDWKHLVAAINSYCPGDGSVPEASMQRIMAETGLLQVYEDENSHLKELFDEVLKEKTIQRKMFICLSLFMCGGNELSKLEHLCHVINDMDMTKNTVAGAELRKVLESLMEVSVLIIPRLGGIEEHREEIGKVPISEAVNKWCSDCNKETLTFEEVRSWGLKCHNFTPGEARAAMLKLAVKESVLLPESKVEPPIQNIPKDELIRTEVPA